MMFLLPLPFIQVPTLNPLSLDRQLLFSGGGGKILGGREIAAQSPQTKSPRSSIGPTVIGLTGRPTARKFPMRFGTANFRRSSNCDVFRLFAHRADGSNAAENASRNVVWSFSRDQVNEVLAERPDFETASV